jgi:hypothetical protein
LPNASEAVERLTTGVGIAEPEPDKLSTTLPPLAFEPIVSVAVRDPTAEGVKV